MIASENELPVKDMATKERQKSSKKDIADCIAALTQTSKIH